MQLRKFMLPVLAITVAVSACTKNDHSPRNPQLSTISNASKPDETVTFTRDSHGRISEATSILKRTVYKYKSGSILEIQSFIPGKQSPVENFTATLNGAGAITAMEGWGIFNSPDTMKLKRAYTYNQANQLIHHIVEFKEKNVSGSSQHTFEWQNGNMVKQINTSSSGIQTLEYTYDLSKQDKLGVTNFTLGEYIEGLEGVSPKNPRATVLVKDNNVIFGQATCHWEYDEQGYPTLEHIKAPNGTTIGLYKYTFK